jgi:hypothetical protein
MIENVPHSNGRNIPILYDNHFIDRVNDPRRMIGKNNLPISSSAVQRHVSKIVDFVAKQPVRSGVKKYGFVHKGNSIIAHVGQGKIHLLTHLGAKPIDNLAKPIKIGQTPGERVNLEQAIYEKVMEKVLTDQIITIVLD